MWRNVEGNHVELLGSFIVDAERREGIEHLLPAAGQRTGPERDYTNRAVARPRHLVFRSQHTFVVGRDPKRVTDSSVPSEPGNVVERDQVLLGERKRPQAGQPPSTGRRSKRTRTWPACSVRETVSCSVTSTGCLITLDGDAMRCPPSGRPVTRRPGHAFGARCSRLVRTDPSRFAGECWPLTWTPTSAARCSPTWPRMRRPSRDHYRRFGCPGCSPHVAPVSRRRTACTRSRSRRRCRARGSTR